MKAVVGKVRKVRKVLFAVLFAVACITFTSTYLEHPLLHVQENYDYHVNGFSISSYPEEQTAVIFPRNFEHPQDEVQTFYEHYFGETDESTNVIKYLGSQKPLSEVIQKQQYKKHSVKIYGASSKSDECDDLLKAMDFNLSNYKSLEPRLERVAKTMLNKLNTDDAFAEMKPFFKNDLWKQLKSKTTQNHWFKFAGSSVWLEQYGVHLMISRIVYSSKGRKRAPILSFVYAQVFNENWEEMEDVELVIPTTDPKTQESIYKNIHFPTYFPIPFYHDVHYQSKRFYGPEDPRILLFKNEMGIEEPLIIFNAYHRKVDKQIPIDEDNMNVTFSYHRLMFMSWPFRFQSGKGSLDGFQNPKYEKNTYNKVVELRRENSKRLRVQKNWTPFISLKERSDQDLNVYFVYRWLKLEILKCPLSDDADGIASCSSQYKRDPKLSIDAPVGEMRGGTEMISLNDYYKTDKEVWIGFARAHLKNCGCGSSMYRPNFAIIVKDGSNYMVTHMSSFMSLNIPVHGWTIPEQYCKHRSPSVLIPNSIAAVGISKDSDYLTLLLSVADDTDFVVHFKNLLQGIRPLIEEAVSVGKSGLDDRVVKCSLQSSSRFCKKFGLEHKPKNS
ncbi:uncharacterized protein PRCAT00003277001 [Priceomyces carsonii]|uniref:uncharacterized protein n=1 Tax=Priceomyces carsonii TaxID=28549 RepID=UPI002EDA2839|nr:unnamed protein product [Priceomyces carsonii]